MAVFIRPARVIVEEGGSIWPAILAVVALAVVVSSAAAVVADIITALAIVTGVAVAGSLTVLAIVLRRNGVAVVQFPPAPARVTVTARPAVAVPAISEPRAIEAPRRAISRSRAARPLARRSATGATGRAERTAPLKLTGSRRPSSLSVPGG